MRIAPLLVSTLVLAVMPFAIGCLDDQIQAPPYKPTPIEPPDATPPVPTTVPDAAPPPDAAVPIDASGPITSHGAIGPGGVVSTSPNYKLITSTNEGTRNISTSPNYKFNGGALDKR